MGIRYNAIAPSVTDTEAAAAWPARQQEGGSVMEFSAWYANLSVPITNSIDQAYPARYRASDIGTAVTGRCCRSTMARSFERITELLVAALVGVATMACDAITGRSTCASSWRRAEMTTWSEIDLRAIAESDDLHIAPLREDGTTYGTPTWLWSVAVDGALYVRAYNGTDSRWYKAAVRQKAGRIVAAVTKEVTRR